MLTERGVRKGRSVMVKWTPKRIKALRKKYGVSQVDFGYKFLGMNITTVGRWERGECQPSPRSIGLLNSVERTINTN